MSVLVMLAFFGVPFAAIIGLVLWAAGRRRDFLRARAHAAAQYGWFQVPPSPWLSEVAYWVYQRGRPGEMVAGDFRGRGMCALDYTYTTTSSNGETTTTTTHQVHLVALNLPVALPPLTLTKDSGFKRMFGGRDLELESKAFNDTFRISCADDRYAHAVLHPRMMEWMLYNPGLEWQFMRQCAGQLGHRLLDRAGHPGPAGGDEQADRPDPAVRTARLRPHGQLSLVQT